eukprot:440787-Pyramimonas_sp.AAC.1
MATTVTNVCLGYDQVLLFSERGIVYSVHAYDIPEGSRQSAGVPLAQLGMGPEKMTAMMALNSAEVFFLATCCR